MRKKFLSHLYKPRSTWTAGMHLAMHHKWQKPHSQIFLSSNFWYLKQSRTEWWWCPGNDCSYNGKPFLSGRIQQLDSFQN